MSCEKFTSFGKEIKEKMSLEFFQSHVKINKKITITKHWCGTRTRPTVFTLYKSKNMKTKKNKIHTLVYSLLSIYAVYVFVFSPGVTQQRNMIKVAAQIKSVKQILNKENKYNQISLSTFTGNRGKSIIVRGFVESEQDRINAEKIIKDNVDSYFKIHFQVRINKK